MRPAPLLAADVAPLRRGACPSLDAPMRTGDGLLARLRIADGRLTPAQLRRVSELAHVHGNGLLEISARGTLQVRGLTENARAPFAEAIEAMLQIQRGLVVETSPLAGDDPQETADPRPLVASIRQIGEMFEGQLAPKLALVVDGGGQIDLSSLKADIRLSALAADRWQLHFGGAEPETLQTAGVPARISALLSRLAALGPSARATDLAPLRTKAVQHSAIPPIGTLPLRTGNAFGIALPFGAIDWHALNTLGHSAARHGITQFRLAPHHALLAIGASTGFAAEAAALGFITDPADPRLRVSACIGSDGCASGHLPARRLAARLAGTVPPGMTLHVSGCPKGCAHPAPADATLVGLEHATGLVIGGRAGDTPATLLGETQIEGALAQALRQG